MDTYIPREAQDIIDIGGGPGRYSLYLAGKGHRVTLFDLSQHHIDVAKLKAKEQGVELAGYIKGNVLDMDGLHDKTYDVVLLMGPLYHLTNEADRRNALSEALKLLKKDGILIASFISKSAPIMDYLAHLQYEISEDEEKELLYYLTNGENKDKGGFTTAYFTDVEEAQNIMADFNLKQMVFAGVENALATRETEICNLPKEYYDRWMNIAYTLSQDKYLLNASNHYLYIGQK